MEYKPASDDALTNYPTLLYKVRKVTIGSKDPHVYNECIVYMSLQVAHQIQSFMKAALSPHTSVS